MDQESFRKLLQTPGVGGSGGVLKSKGSFLPPRAASSSTTKTVDAAQPAFKPRKVKKQSASDYRNRAEERRLGVANDFAEVEAVLETFEKQTAANEDRRAVDEQRRYLGGDSEHSVLVKGLDFALLEQTKARVDAATEDDDSLENAFRETQSTVPQKRSRADIIKMLKEKRAKDDVEAPSESPPPPPHEDKKIEEAKKTGKFKPIGFKPIGEQAESGKKGKGAKEKEGVRKKKKRKVADDDAKPVVQKAEDPPKNPSPPPETTIKPANHVVPLSKPLKNAKPETPDDEMVDIFADAGDYEGINLDDDDEEEGEASEMPPQPPNGESTEQSPVRHKWIEDDEPPLEPPSPPPEDKGKGKGKAPVPEHEQEEGEEQEDTKPIRLQPLASSALPSIRDMLEVDSALDAEQKRKARKEKKKAGGGGGGGEGKKKASAEAKINRDFQKLKSYTDKKGGGSGAG